MKQTNYQLVDFLDFDTEFSREERLWKAGRPVGIEEEGGDVVIRIPFQRQLPSNDLQPDAEAAPREYRMVLRAYGDKVLRVFIDFGQSSSSASGVSDTILRSDSAFATAGTGRDSSAPGVAAVTAGAYPGPPPDSASPMLEIDKQLTVFPLRAEKKEQQWIVRDHKGTIRAIFNLVMPEIDHWSDLLPAPGEAFNAVFYPGGGKELRISAWDQFFPSRNEAISLGFAERKGNPHRTTVSFQAEPGEKFAGTGERFAKMDLSGRTFQLKNQDGQGVNNRRTYKNIPFYLSSEGYGLFLHTTAYGKLSLAGHSSRSVQVMAEEPALDLFLIGGETPEKILYEYRRLTGFPALPPLWSFGVWMSRMSYFSADEVEEICGRLRKENFPCDVIHLDTGWFRTDWLCEWKFNPDRFPDPAGFIARLRENGFRVSLWQMPYIAYQAAQYEEARASKYIGTPGEDNPVSGSDFSALDYAGSIDFSYPEAVKWYQRLLKELLEMGVACIKTDFGEEIHLNAVYHSMEPGLLNNLYALLYQKAAFEITRECTGEGIIWARAGWAGCQRYPLHWGGDAAATWDGMAGSLKGGLHLGLSGFGFWSHDVPGFHGLPDFMNAVIPEELYLRWTQFGVFTSHIRYHGTSKREPWHFPGISAAVRAWWHLRYALIPYILEQSRKATLTGYPVLRALIFHHPEDKTCWHIDDQYYFGDDFLVAPVMNPGGRREVYLPEGNWVHFFSGEQQEGGRWIKVEARPDDMPVWVRQGADVSFYPEKVNCTAEMDLSKTRILRFDDSFKGIWDSLPLQDTVYPPEEEGRIPPGTGSH